MAGAICSTQKVPDLGLQKVSFFCYCEPISRPPAAPRFVFKPFHRLQTLDIPERAQVGDVQTHQCSCFVCNGLNSLCVWRSDETIGAC